MAILLTELIESVESIIETTQEGTKSFMIGGTFMQSDTPNRNNRIYSKSIMEREVNRYIDEYVKQNRALGELSHPANRLNIDPERACHLITELWFDGNDVIGKAKVLETPAGKIVKALLSEGVKVGMSSRALGSLKKRPDGINEVQSDFSLKCVDCVVDPSAHDAWVTALHESKEWVCDNGVWSEKQIEESKTIIKKAPAKLINEIVLTQFEKYLKSL